MRGPSAQLGLPRLIRLLMAFSRTSPPTWGSVLLLISAPRTFFLFPVVVKDRVYRLTLPLGVGIIDLTESAAFRYYDPSRSDVYLSACGFFSNLLFRTCFFFLSFWSALQGI